MAEESNNRAAVFGMGFALGLLFGAGGALGISAMMGGGAADEPVPEPAPVAVVAEPAPEPVVEPEPEPVEAAEAVAAPAPAPKAAPKAASAPKPVAPAPRVAPPTQGPTEVVFEAKDGTRYPASAVPAGSYTVLANWGNGLEKSGKATVSEDKPLKLVCDPKKKSCSAN